MSSGSNRLAGRSGSSQPSRRPWTSEHRARPRQKERIRACPGEQPHRYKPPIGNYQAETGHSPRTDGWKGKDRHQSWKTRGESRAGEQGQLAREDPWWKEEKGSRRTAGSWLVSGGRTSGAFYLGAGKGDELMINSGHHSCKQHRDDCDNPGSLTLLCSYPFHFFPREHTSSHMRSPVHYEQWCGNWRGLDHTLTAM